MKILVLGGTGATGRLVVEQALADGHQVRALVRSPEKLTASNPNLEVVVGQATDASDVTRALDGIDAVVSTLGANKGSVITDATRALIAGAETQGVKRVIIMSSFAVLTARLSRPAKLMTRMMGAIVRDKVAAEELLHLSNLDWTVVHASRLTNGPATGKAKALPANATLKMGDSISRADVAGWLLAAAVDQRAARGSVVVAS